MKIYKIENIENFEFKASGSWAMQGLPVLISMANLSHVKQKHYSFSLLFSIEFLFFFCKLILL